MSEEENKGGEEGLIPLNPPPVEKPNLLGYATVLLLIPLLFTSSLLYFIEGYNKFIQAEEEQAPQYFLYLQYAASPTSRVDDRLVYVSYSVRYIDDDPTLNWPVLIEIINPDEGTPYDCGLRGFDDDEACLITEGYDDSGFYGGWATTQHITLSENGVDICSAQCDLIVRVHTPVGISQADIYWER
jgi:hypothetical protein